MKQIRKTWKLKDQAQLLKRLGEMTEGGYTLLDGIRLMELQMNKRQVADLADAITRLREGAPFYQVLKSLSFHKEAVGICYFAEIHGELPASMIQSGELLERKIAQGRPAEKGAAISAFPHLHSRCHVLYVTGRHHSSVFRYLSIDEYGNHTFN